MGKREGPGAQVWMGKKARLRPGVAHKVPFAQIGAALHKESFDFLLLAPAKEQHTVIIPPLYTQSYLPCPGSNQRT